MICMYCIQHYLHFFKPNIVSLFYKRDRAQKARENLRRENGAEEIRRAFEKSWGKKGMAPFCFRNQCDSDRPPFLIKHAAS